MIYCIGQRLVYERAFATQPMVVKDGRKADGYPGGWVFRTVADAQAFLAQKGLTYTHAVYGVVAEWDSGTEQLPGESYRRLLKASQVVKLQT